MYHTPISISSCAAEDDYERNISYRESTRVAVSNSYWVPRAMENFPDLRNTRTFAVGVISESLMRQSKVSAPFGSNSMIYKGLFRTKHTT